MTLPRPHPGQRAVKKTAKRYNVLACGRRWGKSTLALELLATPALDGYPVGYFTPNYKLLLEVWRACVSTLRPAILRINGTERRIELVTGGVLEFWTLNDPDAGRSRKYKRVVIDEAGLHNDLMEIWQAAIRPTLADLAGDAWFMGTPKGHNDFEVLFKRASEDGYPDWQSWQRPTEDNPYISPHEVRELRLELGELVASQEVDAQFIDGLSIDRYLPNIILWDSCAGPVPPLSPREPLVIALDAATGRDATASDCFGLVGVSRHPERPDDLMVRVIKLWQARAGHEIDFMGTPDAPGPERFIRDLCERYAVYQVCYDPHQLVFAAQRFTADGVVWMAPFRQAGERLEADKLLLDLIAQRRITHDGDTDLRRHLMNADRKIDAESRKIRIVKRSESLKIDLAVALSMAAKRCLDLNL